MNYSQASAGVKAQTGIINPKGRQKSKAGHKHTPLGSLKPGIMSNLKKLGKLKNKEFRKN